MIKVQRRDEGAPDCEEPDAREYAKAGGKSLRK
jgi:hypothetical protein